MSLQKRAPRYSVNDWFNNSYSNWKNSEKTRLEGRNIVEESKYLRNEVDNKTKWDQHDSNSRLADNVERLRVIKEYIEAAIKKLDDELRKMGLTKDITEKLQNFFYQTNQVNTENLVWREGRRDIDLVVDEVEDELHKEKLILDTVQEKIQTKLSQMFEQLAVTKEARYKLYNYLQRKDVSMDVDIDQYNSTENSPGISLKPDATRVPETMLTWEKWEEVYCQMKELAESTFNQSIRLRETINHVINTINNDLNTQNLLILFALRKRLHELEIAISEDKFQISLLEEQYKKLEEESRCIDVAIKHKTTALKLAETRLENRMYKTQEDIVRDSTQCGLADEMRQLELNLAVLREQKCQIQHAMANIEKQLRKLREDLDNKLLALRIDQQCYESRKRMMPDCQDLAREIKDAIVACVRPDRANIS